MKLLEKDVLLWQQDWKVLFIAVNVVSQVGFQKTIVLFAEAGTQVMKNMNKNYPG